MVGVALICDAAWLGDQAMWRQKHRSWCPGL